MVENRKHNGVIQQTHKSLGIRGRLLLGFGGIVLILIVAIAIVLVKTTTSKNFASHVIRTDFPAFNDYFDLNGYLIKSQAALYGWIITQDPKFKNDFVLAWTNITRVQQSLNIFSKEWPTDYLNKWQNVQPLIEQLKTVETNILDTSTSTNEALSKQLLTDQFNPVLEKVIVVLDGPIGDNGDRVGGLYDRQYDQLQTNAQDIVDNMDTIKIIEYVLLIVGVSLSILITFFTARRILQPLHSAIDVAKEIAAGKRDLNIEVTSNDEMGELLTALNSMQQSINTNETQLKESQEQARALFENIVQTANIFSAHSTKVAAGDLTQRITIEKNDEMSALGHDLNSMTDSLSNVTKQITEACHQMVSTLSEVKQAVDMQSSGAAEQASSITQITASLEEIEKSSTETIDKAKTLGGVAEQTRVKGREGLEAVEQCIAGMKLIRDKVQMIATTILDLSNKTQQVGEITSVVNTLAQQSKMLALNASIEAAKAGEAGKGFAVVAVEVKNLAEQSEQSTLQVQKILEDISHATEKAVMATEEGTKGVDQGTSLVEQTGEIVRNLSEVIYETTLGNQQIEAAIRQEGAGIEQITAGMNEINQVTNSFVVSVKQTTEAIDNLTKIARSLKEQVDIYKV